MAGGLFFTESLGFYDHRDAELVCCDGQTIPVHGVIIQQHSAPLNKAITVKKEEFYTRPHKPGEVVKLAVQGDGQTVNRVISFIYTSTYSDNDSKLSFAITTPPPESLLINLTDDSPVTAFEDGSVESLQFWFQNLEISPKDFKSPRFSKAWANAKVFRVASEWGVERLVVESSNRFTAFISGSSDQDGFKEFVRAVYSSFPDNELCECIADECANNLHFVVEHLGDLLKDKGLLSYKILLKVVKQTAVLSSQALRLLPPAQDQVTVLKTKVAMLEAALAKSAQANNASLRLMPAEAIQTNGHANSKAEVASLKNLVAKLKKQFDEKSEDVDHQAYLLTEGDLELAKLREVVQDLTNDRGNLRVTIASLQKAVRDVNAGNEKLSKEVKLFKDEDKKKEGRINKAKSLVQEKDARIHALQAEVNQLRANIEESIRESAGARVRQEDQVLAARQGGQMISILDTQSSATSRLEPSRNRENQRPTFTTSDTLIDISPVTSPLRQPFSTPLTHITSINGTSGPNASSHTNGGPETFIDRLNRQRQGAAGIHSTTNGGPSAPSPTPAQTAPAPTINGARTSTTQGAASSMQMAPRSATPATAPDSHALATYQAAIAQRDQEIAKIRRDLGFYQAQLRDLRTGPASTITTRGGPVRPSGGDSRLEALLRALKEASLEHRACGECLFNFNCQFRGITEDRNVRHLIMKCTKCEAEAARWDV